MNASKLDRYQKSSSVIHKLDPRIKILVSLLFILSNILLPDRAYLGFFLSWLLIIWINSLAKLTWSYTLVRSFIVFPFALTAFTVAFTLPGETITSWKVGAWILEITDTGLIRFFSILIRSWLSVQIAILLTATTTFPDIAHGLRHLNFPRILISIFSFMYRYLFVLSDEAQRLLRARSARSGKGKNNRKISVIFQAKLAGNMVGQLFLRSLDRSENIYSAMQARGFQGQFLTLRKHHLEAKDYWIGFFAILLISSIQLIQLFL